MIGDEYITVGEAAKYLNRTKTNVCWLCRNGKLTGAKKFGAKVWMIPKKAVIDHTPGLQGFAAVKARKQAEMEMWRSFAKETAQKHAQSAEQEKETTQS